MFWVMVVFSCLVGPLGVLVFMAGAMSDAPTEGDRAGKQGGLMVLASIVCLLAAAVLRHKGII